MPNVAAATIVAKSYLSFARVMAESFNRIHRDVPFFVLLPDQADGYLDPSQEPFQMVRLSELDIPRVERFRFQYGQQPLTYASTPYLLAALLNRGFTRLIFIKQESLVLGSLIPVFEIYCGRSDLQHAFPDVFSADNGAFHEWIRASGVMEHTIAEAFAQ